MSFSADVKNEIARSPEEKKCCMLAEIAGFIRMCGSVKLSGGGKLDLRITTENPALARLFLLRIKSYFGVGANLKIRQRNLLKKGHTYQLTIGAEDNAEQILRETGILRVREGSNYLPEDISSDLTKSRCCKRAYLRGTFLGAGTISHPDRSYHMEIVSSSEILANDLKRLINSFGFRSKVTARKNNFVVYLKESEQISDFLALLGANNQVMEFENVRIVKELRNKTNRIVNCESANMDKTIDTAARQIEAIRFIEAKGGPTYLPEKLREIALLRLENPESSLTELGQMLEPPLKKSGVNHRFRKIEEIAETLR